MTAREVLEQLRQPPPAPASGAADLIPKIAFLKAKGLTTPEISSALGLTVQEVTFYTRQPAFHKQLLALLAAKPNLGDSYITGEGWSSVVVMSAMRDDPNVPAAVRLSCARELANRAFGQPRQVQEVFNRSSESEPTTPSEITERIAKLEQELRRYECN